MRGIYAIVDVGTLSKKGIDPVAFAEALLDAPLAALQLRAKGVGAREMMGLLRSLAPMCHRHGVPLVANDRADLAALAGADMVHVGQTDAAADFVRRIAPGLGIGISTHRPDELVKALHLRPSYVAFGPIFSTATKADAEPVVGTEGLHEAATMARAAGVPLVAIGGVTEGNIAALVGLADAVAVISALVPDGSPAAGAAEFFDAVTERARHLDLLFSGPGRRAVG